MPSVFATFGYANTFGAFQSYYQLYAFPHKSASDISWIGSVQLFFQFSLGAVAGPLYDKGYFRHLMVTGSVLYMVRSVPPLASVVQGLTHPSLFMISLCKEYWQVFLAQAIGVGLGIGLLFLPALSIISQYFSRRRATATGIVTAGSSLGGISPLFIYSQGHTEEVYRHLPSNHAEQAHRFSRV